MISSSESFKENFELLLQGKKVERIINENFTFPDLVKNQSAVWSLLLATGYLKIIAYNETDWGSSCQLSIPNKEIRNLYREIIEQWLANDYGVEWYREFLQNLLAGNIDAFETGLQHIFEQTVSVHDVAKQPEAFYHGLIIGLTASLYGHPNYIIR